MRVSLLLAAAVLILAPGPPARAGEAVVGRFSAGDLSGWSRRPFQGWTKYRLKEEGGRRVLKADSRGTASGLIKKVGLDPKVHRYLRWSWRIGGVVENGDCRTKQGDDVPARVMVIFRGPGEDRVKVLNYIWANVVPQGFHLRNPRLGEVVMVAVRSGEAQAGQWLGEERDLVADFRTFFGQEPPLIRALALMTDTDDTGGRAMASYGDIILATEPGSEEAEKIK